MITVRRRLRKSAWLALVAMCAVAFGPTVSRSLNVVAEASVSTHAGMGTPMHMAGMAHRESSPAGHSGSGHSSNLLDCCALCAVAASPFTAVAFQLPDIAPQVAVNAPALGDADAASGHLAPWSNAPPRGPPRHS